MAATKIAAALAAALLALGVPAQAQEDAPAPCEGEAYRAFDFWLGDWWVNGADGSFAGSNRVTSEEEGCLILERWTSARGATGQSYNFLDPANGLWRQLWVSEGAVIDYSGSLNAEGEMVLEGEIAYRSGRIAPFRGTWTPMEDGSVRQHFQEQDTETGEWSDWFIGLYQPAAPQPSDAASSPDP